MIKIFSIIVAIAVELVCQVNSTEIKEDFNVDKTFRIKEFSYGGEPLIIK